MDHGFIRSEGLPMQIFFGGVLFSEDLTLNRRLELLIILFDAVV